MAEAAIADDPLSAPAPGRRVPVVGTVLACLLLIALTFALGGCSSHSFHEGDEGDHLPDDTHGSGVLAPDATAVCLAVFGGNGIKLVAVDEAASGDALALIKSRLGVGLDPARVHVVPVEVESDSLDLFSKAGAAGVVGTQATMVVTLTAPFESDAPGRSAGTIVPNSYEAILIGGSVPQVLTIQYCAD